MYRQQIMIKYFVFILALSVLQQPCAAKINEYQIKFGIMAHDSEGKLIVVKETKKIPLIINDSNFMYGFIVNKLDGGKFTAELVVHFPKIPKKLTGLADKNKLEENKSMRFKLPIQSGKWEAYSRFHEGDPVGVWRYDVYINGFLYKQIEFEVIEKL